MAKNSFVTAQPTKRLLKALVTVRKLGWVVCFAF